MSCREMDFVVLRYAAGPTLLEVLSLIQSQPVACPCVVCEEDGRASGQEIKRACNFSSPEKAPGLSF